MIGCSAGAGTYAADTQLTMAERNGEALKVEGFCSDIEVAELSVVKAYLR